MKTSVSIFFSIVGMIYIFTGFAGNTVWELGLQRNEIIVVLLFLVFTLSIIDILLDFKRVTLMYTILTLGGATLIAKLEYDIGLKFGWHFNQMMALACLLGVTLMLFHFFIVSDCYPGERS